MNRAPRRVGGPGRARALDILFCTHEPLLPLSGGCTLGNLRLVERFAARGHRVRVLGPLNLDAAAAKAALDPVEAVPFQPWRMGRTIALRFPKYLAYAALYGAALDREVRRRRPDVLLVRNAVLALPVAAARRRWRIPAMLSYTDLLSLLLAGDPSIPSPLLWALRVFETKVGQRFDAVAAISQPLLDALVRAGQPRERAFLSLDGADVRSFRPGACPPSERARRRGRLGLKRGQRLALFHGTVELHHGQALLPRLLDQARRADPGLHFLIIAGGPGAAALERALQGRGGVSVLPFQPPQEVGRWASCCDVGFVPYEPSPGLDLVFTLKLLEYFAAGLPVVSYRLRAAQETFGPSPAWTVAGQEGEFVQALSRQSRRAGDKGLRARVLREFTWEAVADRLEARLRSIVATPFSVL